MYATLPAFLVIPNEFHQRQMALWVIPVKINSSVSLCVQLTGVVPLHSVLPPI